MIRQSDAISVAPESNYDPNVGAMSMERTAPLYFARTAAMLVSR
jgi:hypothetical protein